MFEDIYNAVAESMPQAKHPLLSPRPYSFNPSGMLAGLKRTLTNVRSVDAECQDLLAAERHREAHKPGKVFKCGQGLSG
jgi:hypothetical protein